MKHGCWWQLLLFGILFFETLSRTPAKQALVYIVAKNSSLSFVVICWLPFHVLPHLLSYVRQVVHDLVNNSMPIFARIANRHIHMPTPTSLSYDIIRIRVSCLSKSDNFSIKKTLLPLIDLCLRTSYIPVQFSKIQPPLSVPPTKKQGRRDDFSRHDIRGDNRYLKQAKTPDPSKRCRCYAPRSGTGGKRSPVRDFLSPIAGGGMPYVRLCTKAYVYSYM